MDALPLHPCRFDGYRLDPRTRVLLGPDGEPVPLSPRALDVLVHLVQHADRIVSKDELLQTVWQGRVVEENTLTQAVSTLRRALGTGAGDHRYVVTVPGRGYRFVAELAEDAPEPAAAPAAEAGSGSPPLRTASRATWIAASIALAAFLALLAAWPGADRRGGAISASASIPTLAVLPFRQVSDDSRDELLALGLAETLITRLGRHEGLRVRSLGSAARSSAAGEDVIAAGRALGARFLVDGSTQRSGDRVRVNARLVSVPSEDTLWAETYDTLIADVFTVQDDIAHAVSAALGLRDERVADAIEAPCDGRNAEAYRAYLSGHHLLQMPSSDGLRRAIGEFRRALELDPTCARAWAGQAFAWRGMAITGDQEPLAVFPIARAAVERALALDPGLAEAYASLGFIQFWHDWDWSASEASLQRAIELNPSLAEARFSYAHLLSNLGRHEQALDQVRQARELDPLSPLINTLEARFLLVAGQPEAARQRVEHVLKLAPGFWIALLTRASLAMEEGEMEAAEADAKAAVTNSSGATSALATLGAVYVRAGRPDDARTLLASLQAQSADTHVPAGAMAILHNALGEHERALDLLEQALDERDLRLTFLKVERGWDNLRDDPRFIAILRAVGLEDDQIPAQFGRRSP
jgi:DNA-binding winged helix-turn-helix (wHTH) protein/TolB-like protein/tetratricopeptide (TPR) repeat protein